MILWILSVQKNRPMEFCIALQKTVRIGQAVLDCGYYVSFSGIISFKNAQDLRDVAKQVPLDRVLIAN